VPPDTAALWEEAKELIQPRKGVISLDDTTLDKPYAKKIELVHRHWSGKHHRVVRGINLLTLLWTDGDRRVPCDFRVYDKPNDQKTKNDHFQALIQSKL
jgi:putative transposase